MFDSTIRNRLLVQGCRSCNHDSLPHFPLLARWIPLALCSLWSVGIALVLSSVVHAASENPTPGKSEPTPKAAEALVEVKERSEISQYGITWKFDRPAMSGQFINGDWWVVGPVTVASVTPGPTQGPLEGEVSLPDAIKEDVKHLDKNAQAIFGWVHPVIAAGANDCRMRNGSMVITRFGPSQGYDSRTASYDPAASVTFPFTLDPDRTLVSTISMAHPIGENFCRQIAWRTEKQQRSLLRAAAVLTSLSEVPPPDAFRPPYAGTWKPIFRASDLRRDLLLNLELENWEDYFRRPWLNPDDPACEIATWEDFERFFQRPWLGEYGCEGGFDQALLYMQPVENQPTSYSATFGREDTRLVSIASLMLHLDVPMERKEKLLIGLVQRGIDLAGIYKTETTAPCAWIQSGNKWPILFASIMLDQPELRKFPQRPPFHEDIATYYGTGWFGQNALWRIVWHGHLIDSEEERSPEQMTRDDHISRNYRSYGSSGKAWLGTALAARLMKAIDIWDHDAFFDYCDRWIDEDPSYASARGPHKKPEWESTTWEPFVTAMWKAHRKNAPEQPKSGKNFKAHWEKKEDGWHYRWEGNPIPTPKEIADHLESIRKAFPEIYPTIE